MSRRQQIVWVLAVVALLAAGVAVWMVAAAADRFYRFGDPPLFAMPLCWTAATAVYLCYVWFSRSRPRRWLRIVFAVMLVLATMFLWAITTFLEAFDDRSVVRTVAVSPDGRVELATEKYMNLIDPACRVWLLERGGLFSRRALVWHLHEGNCPTQVFFSNDTTIAIRKNGDTEPTTTTFDADRMQVTPM